MKKISSAMQWAFLVLAWAISCLAARPAALVRYDFGGDSAEPDQRAAGVSATPFRAGPDLNRVLLGDGFPSPGWSAEGWSTASTINPDTSGSYAFLRLTPQPGEALTLTSLSFDFRPHGSGPRRGQVEVLVGDLRRPSLPDWIFAHPDQSLPTDPDFRKTWERVSLSSDAFQDITETVEIRIYAYDAQHSDRDLAFDSIVLNGDVTFTPVPEPRLSLLLAAGGGLVAWGRPRAWPKARS